MPFSTLWRALAIKLDDSMGYDDEIHGGIFKRRSCIAFTNAETRLDSRPEEIDFINDVMGTKGGGTVLIAVGDPESIENAFEEYGVSAAKPSRVIL